MVEAYLGDTDHDGVLEVVTLLDDEEGRHLGLFAYNGGEYREQLVTSELAPRPVTLEVVNFGRAHQDDEVLSTAALAGDLIVLTLERAEGQTQAQTLLLRWNGFSFTGIDSSPGQ